MAVSVIECFPDLFTPVQVGSLPTVASDITYDGANLVCVTFSNGDKLDTVIENIDAAICDIKNNLLKTIPTSDVTLYDGTPTFSCFSFVATPTLNQVIDKLGVEICANRTTIAGLEGNDIIYQGPTIDNIPGVDTGDNLDDIIDALDDELALITANNDLIPGIILALGDLTDSWVVSGGDVAGTSGLTVDLDGATYNVDGTRVVVVATSGIVLSATSDNYVDVDATGAYVVTAVAVAAPAPAIVGLRLYKFETNATVVVGTTDLRNVWPINGAQIVDTTITGAKMVANTITTTQLDVLIGSPGETLQANVTVDASGRITAIDTDFNLDGAPSDGDAITFDTGTGKWISGDISSTFFPSGAEHDTMRLDGTGAWLSSSLLTNNTTSIGVGTSTPDASAIFDVVSTTQGIGNPNMDETARDAIGSPKSGLQVYNTDTNKINYFNGTVWLVLETGAVAADAWSTVLGVGNTSGANDAIFDKLGVAASVATQVGSQKIQFQNSLFDGAEAVTTFDLGSVASTAVGEETFLTVSYLTANLFQLRQDGALYLNMGATAPFGSGIITAIQNTDGSGGGLVLSSTSGSIADVSLSADAEDMIFGSLATTNYSFGGTTGTVNARAIIMNTAAQLPTANPADAFQMYSADHSGIGTATVHFTNEQGHTMNLHEEALVTDTQGVADALTAMGLLVSSTITDVIPDITDDFVPRGTGTTIEDGTWKNVGNDLFPVTDGSNLGSPTNGIGTLFMSSTIDYGSNLLWVSSASTRMTLTTAGLLGIGVAPANESLELSGAILLGTASATVDGTVRWTGADFEGRKGGAWISLTTSVAESLATTLAVGFTTGANDISVDTGQSIIFNNSGNTATISEGTLGGNIILTLPITTGTFALTSDIPAAQNLDSVLTAGGASGGNNISMTSADTIIFNNGAFTATIGEPTLGGNISLTLPASSGTFALISDIPAHPVLTNDRMTRGDGTTAEDGTWSNVGNNIYPETTGSNIGQDANRIGTLFMSSTIDFSTDLIFNSTTEQARLTTDGNFGLGATAFGTNAANVFSLGLGTAPTTEITDTVRMYTTTGLDFIIHDETGTTLDLFTLTPDGIFTAGNSGSTIASNFVIDATNFLIIDAPTAGGITVNVPSGNKRAEFVRASGTGEGQMVLYDNSDAAIINLLAKTAGSYINTLLAIGGTTISSGVTLDVQETGSNKGLRVQGTVNPFILLAKTSATAVSTFMEYNANRFRIFHNGFEAFNIADATRNIKIGGTTAATARFQVTGADNIDTATLIIESLAGTNILEVQNSSKIGFFAATPAVQVADSVALTDSTGGTANNTVAAVSGSGDDATINDNFADLVAKYNALRDHARAHGLMA